MSFNVVELAWKKWLRRKQGQLAEIVANIESKLMDAFLETLLSVVWLSLRLDKNFRRSIEALNARYVFRSRDGAIVASAIFENGKMKVKRKAVENPTIEIVFKDGKALWEYLMAGNPDVFSFVLDGKIEYKGNLNYLMKFGYLARHLQLQLGL